jgi:lambda family phage portal protein
MNFIEKTISIFSPSAALKRAQANYALQTISEHTNNVSKRNFEAAGRGRRTDGWRTTNASPIEEVSPSLHVLRVRGRQLANNNAWAKRGIEVVANNTIGGGIRPALKKGRTKNRWEEWAETTACDFYEQTNFYGLQWQVMHTVARSGEAIVIRYDTPKGPRLQVLEGDYLDQGKNYLAMKPNDNYAVDGIEFDPQGRRVAYYIYESNPMLFKAPSKRIEASRVLHIFQSHRPGQVRGIPFLYAVMLRLRDFDDFEDAELLKQKIAACFAVFVTENGNEGAPGGTNKSDEVDIPDSIEPGMVSKLAPGQDVSFATPPSTEGYGGYSRNQLLAIAAGLGITYEAMTGDLSNVNFSSGRMGWLEMQRNIQRWQDFMIVPQFCQKVWAWFNDYAVLTGAGSTPLVRWTPPRREMIDPAKEISAMGEAIRYGLLTWDEANRQNGYEPDAVVAEIQARNKSWDDSGVLLASDPRNFPTATGPAKAAEEPVNPKTGK